MKRYKRTFADGSEVDIFYTSDPSEKRDYGFGHINGSVNIFTGSVINVDEGEVVSEIEIPSVKDEISKYLGEYL